MDEKRGGKRKGGEPREKQRQARERRELCKWCLREKRVGMGRDGGGSRGRAGSLGRAGCKWAGTGTGARAGAGPRLGCGWEATPDGTLATGMRGTEGAN